jgi:pimeloyl-ACP methyl ester carboxylesterase
MEGTSNPKTGYSQVSGLDMYYEIYGQGKTLVLIHGGGSTIQTSFARIIPLLAKNRQIIAVELQAHGRTGDRNSDLTFEQDADDLAQLLKNLRINRADVLGFSNGGHTTIEMALRHPGLVSKIIICSAFYKRNAAVPEFWAGFEKAKLSDMPQVYQDEFLKVNNNPSGLLNMFNKDVQRMRVFKGWSDAQMKSIKLRTFIVNGTADVGSPEHAVEMFRIMPNSQLAILPGGHGEYLGEITTQRNGNTNDLFIVPMIEEFLDKAE